MVAMAASSGNAMKTPLHVGALAPITDEFGGILCGNAIADPATCDRVELLWASNSVSHAPEFDGSPHPDNPPVAGGTTWIGSLASPALLKPGIFAMSIGGAFRPPNNSTVFVRTYNAPTRAAASFYADSQMLETAGNSVLIAQIGATTNAIDPRDTDGDGLNNSWEKSLGSDANRRDTDGDGVSDGDEFRAGTGLTDSNSVFVVALVSPLGDDGLRIEWNAVAGKTYVVEYNTNNLSDKENYQEFEGYVTAEETGRIFKLVPGGWNLSRIHVRVRLVE
jgi:hypothetical protein